MAGTLTADEILDRTSGSEAWKYTRVDEILSGTVPAAATPATVSLTRAAVEDLAGDLGAVQIVIVDGQFDASLSRTRPTAVAVSTASTAARNGAATDRLAERARDDAMDHLNQLAAPHVTVIDVPAGTRLDAAVHIVYISAGSAGETGLICHPRTAITVGEDAHIEIVETFVGLPPAITTNAVTTLRLGRGATLNHARIQQEPDESHHVGLLMVEQDEGSELRSTSIMSGALISRFAMDVTLIGAHAIADLAGLSFTHDEQQQDHTVTVEHAADGGHSNQTYRAVLADRSKAAFTGHVIVGPGTTGTEAHQTSRSLAMSDRAEASTRPWLEIHADDVRCTHGATVGRLDDEHLFYLRSRGIPIAEATAILTSAFASEITARVDPAVTRHACPQLPTTEDQIGDP